jgi:hypothetical protein
MKKNTLYAFVFRFHNSGSPVSYDVRMLSVKDAREYYNYLLTQYDYVFMFKQFD